MPMTTLTEKARKQVSVSSTQPGVFVTLITPFMFGDSEPNSLKLLNQRANDNTGRESQYNFLILCLIQKMSIIFNLPTYRYSPMKPRNKTHFIKSMSFSKVRSLLVISKPNNAFNRSLGLTTANQYPHKKLGHRQPFLPVRYPYLKSFNHAKSGVENLQL